MKAWHRENVCPTPQGAPGCDEKCIKGGIKLETADSNRLHHFAADQGIFSPVFFFAGGAGREPAICSPVATIWQVLRQTVAVVWKAIRLHFIVGQADDNFRTDRSGSTCIFRLGSRCYHPSLMFCLSTLSVAQRTGYFAPPTVLFYPKNKQAKKKTKYDLLPC